MNNKMILITSIITSIIITAIACFNIGVKAKFSEVSCIKFLESGSQTAMTSASHFKAKKSNLKYEEYLKKVETDFAQDEDFIKIFKSDVKKLDEFSKENLNNLYPDLTDGSATPIWYNSISEELQNAEISMLQKVILGYCLKRQDSPPCIKFLNNI